MNANAPILSDEETPEQLNRVSDLPSPLAIDRSSKIVVSAFSSCALLWLLFGCFLFLLTSIKLHAAEFLADSPLWTYGRLRPAAMNALVYGFASQAAFGVSVWILARLGRTLVRTTALLMLGGAFWNIGLVLGIGGILAGHLTGYEWLEIPRFAVPILFASYLLIGCGVLDGVAARRVKELYVSQWFLLAAFLWFPWIYSTAQMLLVFWPVRGALQVVVNGWFAKTLFDLWLIPVALAVLLYFIPKLLGRPLQSRYLALFAFWLLALLGGWGGVHVAAPLPKWISSVSVTANVLMIVPYAIIALMLHQTLSGSYRACLRDEILRFFLVAAVCYLAAGLLATLGSFRSISELTQFTYYSLGTTSVQIFGLLGMSFSGAVYFILPRVLGISWPSPHLISWHFRAGSAGLLLTAVPLILGGVFQGMLLNDAGVTFLSTTRTSIPFLGLNTLGNTLTLVGFVLLGINLTRLFTRACEGCCKANANETSNPAPTALRPL